VPPTYRPGSLRRPQPLDLWSVGALGEGSRGSSGPTGPARSSGGRSVPGIEPGQAGRLRPQPRLRCQLRVLPARRGEPLCVGFALPGGWGPDWNSSLNAGPRSGRMVHPVRRDEHWRRAAAFPLDRRQPPAGCSSPGRVPTPERPVTSTAPAGGVSSAAHPSSAGDGAAQSCHSGSPQKLERAAALGRRRRAIDYTAPRNVAGRRGGLTGGRGVDLGARQA